MDAQDFGGAMLSFRGNEPCYRQDGMLVVVNVSYYSAGWNKPYFARVDVDGKFDFSCKAEYEGSESGGQLVLERKRLKKDTKYGFGQACRAVRGRRVQPQFVVWTGEGFLTAPGCTPVKGTPSPACIGPRPFQAPIEVCADEKSHDGCQVFARVLPHDRAHWTDAWLAKTDGRHYEFVDREAILREPAAESGTTVLSISTDLLEPGGLYCLGMSSRDQRVKYRQYVIWDGTKLVIRRKSDPAFGIKPTATIPIST